MKLAINENLKKLRAKTNVTQEKLAAYLGVSFQAVSRWENGIAYPDIELLPEIARFFGVSLDELMGGENSEKDAEERAIRIINDLRSAGKEETLRSLRELEKQYPNNWKIKEMICSLLVDPKPESYDEILPELRKYAYEALKLFPKDKEKMAEWFIRYMVVAVPEEEVDEWASQLEPYGLNLRWNIMKIRYQERGDWEKARHYESLQKITALHDLTLLGPIPEVMYGSTEANILPAQIAMRVVDAMVGTPYRDENGKVHNSIMLYDRLGWCSAIVICHIGDIYCSGSEQVITDGLAALEKLVDYACLYADAVKEEYFVSDNPYLEPQKIGDHWLMDIAEQNTLREHSLDSQLFALRDEMIYPPLLEDDRFKAQIKRLQDKKAEIAEYWRTQA